MTQIPIEEIVRGSLPPELILDDFIYGFQSSYEDYLVDFVNKSKIFSELSSGKEYRHPPKDEQNNGECDCCSENYSLDFKLFGTRSSLYASRKLSLQKTMPCPGVIAKGPPDQVKDMEVALTNNLLRMYSLDDLLAIDGQKALKFDRDHLCPETEVKSILKTMKCKKNVLYFYKDFIFTKKEYALEDTIKTLEPYINKCFSSVFKFRDQFVSNRDAFFAVIVQGYLCLAAWENNIIHFKESIPLSSSSEFMKLYNMVDSRYKETLFVR